jgi:glycosyltransferase involved in cell wall biosynthesis
VCIDVSVVIPAFNGSEFIVDALESGFRQSLAPREIIVVDDASTDGTPDLVSAVARGVPIDVRLIRLSSNSGGPARPMNVGIAAASGRYIAVLDQDDRFLPDKLQALARLLGSDRSEIGMIIHDSVLTSEDGEALSSVFARRPLLQERFARCGDRGVLMLTPQQSFRVICREHCIGHKGIFAKRAWEAVGGYDPSFRCAADLDFGLRVSSRYNIFITNQVLNVSISHGNNLSSRGQLAASECVTMFSKMLGMAGSEDDKQHLRRRIRKELSDLAYSRRKSGNWLGSLRCWLQAARLAPSLRRG